MERCIVRKEIVENGELVPVGNDYYDPAVDDNTPKDYFWDKGGRLYVNFSGVGRLPVFKACIGTDWDFIKVEPVWKGAKTNQKNRQ